MRKAETSNFFLAYLINLILNFEWSIPAWILLGLHFWLKIPIFLFWLALGLWLGGSLLFMLILELIRRSTPPDVPPENKNPYSAKNPSYIRNRKGKKSE